MGFTAYVGGRVYNFSITAGDNGVNPPGSSLGLIGYASGATPYPDCGSISAQPISGHTIMQVARSKSSGALIVTISGDALAILSDMRLLINGTDTGVSWSYSSTTDRTSGSVVPSPVTFVNGQTYNIQIRR